MQRLVPTSDQARAIRTILRTDSGAALCTATLGAGKSLLGVEVARGLSAKVVLVVCPLGTRVGWENTFVRQGLNLPVYRVDSSKKGKAALGALLRQERGVYLVGREYMRRLPADKMKPDLTIYDEVHGIQNRKSKSFRVMRQIKTGFRLGLSATPFRNKFEGAYAVTKWLWPDVVENSFWRWVAKWCQTEYDPFTYNNQKVVSEKEPGRYVNQLPCYVQFESKVGKPVTEYRYVDLTPAQRKMYAAMEEDSVAWLKDHPLVAELPVSQRVRLRQIALGTPEIVGTKWVTRERKEQGVVVERYKVEVDDVRFLDDCKSTKLDALKEILSDLDDEPVLILVDSARFAEVVTSRLGNKARLWYGDTPHSERESLVRDFGKNFQWLVATIGSISEGVDGLQHNCHYMVWLSKSEDGVLNEQASGRLARTGQKHQVVSYEIIARETLDEGVVSALLEDQLAMNATLRKEQENE